MLAVQADAIEVYTTVDKAQGRQEATPLQRAFQEEHGLQCGFCPPPFLPAYTTHAALGRTPADEEESARSSPASFVAAQPGYRNWSPRVERSIEGTAR